VGVLGCMAERDGTDLIDRMPVVDLLCGPGRARQAARPARQRARTRDSLLADDPRPQTAHAQVRSTSEVRRAPGQGNRRAAARPSPPRPTRSRCSTSTGRSPRPTPSSTSTGKKFSAYVRITRGCNKFCTYCVVPFTRGAEVHRPPDHIIDECKRLADAGVIEITLLGQTVNHYRFEHGAAVSLDGITQPQKGRAFKGGHRRDPLAGESVTTFADLLAASTTRSPRSSACAS
jgi:tRNA-2-methylthio-N6-dimethylallyladenosine synthase